MCPICLRTTCQPECPNATSPAFRPVWRPEHRPHVRLCVACEERPAIYGELCRICDEAQREQLTPAEQYDYEQALAAQSDGVVVLDVTAPEYSDIPL